MKRCFIFSDRDGTINKDENYYLGSDPEWRAQVEFLPGVVEGIKTINALLQSFFYILTNQSGVALTGGQLDNLNLERMHEVNKFIISELIRMGAQVDGYYACPYVDSNYATAAAQKGQVVDTQFIVDGHADIKPATGMIEKALAAAQAVKGDSEIFVIGDRANDVQMALNIGGTGILVQSPKTKELGDVEKVQAMSGKVFIASDFLTAANYIKKSFNLK
ncbi:MAG: HAD hydrolase-like protein [Deltaproteobacteria bacterium]|nr:HAD hydrolase-like protein [Deltaproteobacteria bacterium]